MNSHETRNSLHKEILHNTVEKSRTEVDSLLKVTPAASRATWNPNRELLAPPGL